MLTLTDPQVQEAKASFERRTRCTKTSFEQVLNFLQSGTSPGEFCRAIGISRQSLSSIYYRHFFPLFQKPLKELWRERVKRRQDKRALQTFIKRGFGHMIDAICAVRLPIEYVAGYRSQLRGFIRINGWVCNVHLCTSHIVPVGMRSLGYSIAHVSHAILFDPEVDAIIAHVAIEGIPKRTFVIPTQVLRKRYPPGARYKWLRLYLPLERRAAYHNIRAELDFAQYENTWHVLATRA